MASFDNFDGRLPPTSLKTDIPALVAEKFAGLTAHRLREPAL